MTAKFRTTRRATLAGLSALALACGARAQTPKKGGTLTFLQNAEPTSLISLTNVATPSLSVCAKTTEGLLEYDYAVNPRPALATEWSISPDGLRYSFKLRPNVKFHDGKPFTSADVAYSIQLLKTVHPRGRNTFANVVEVQTPDPLTAVIVLSKPAPYLIKAFPGGRIADGAEAHLRGYRSDHQPERQRADRHRTLPVQGMGARQPRDLRAQSRTTGIPTCRASTAWSASSCVTPARARSRSRTARATSATAHRWRWPIWSG